MSTTSRKFNIASAIIFFITFAVYFMSAERTGSLWDCGEFILGAYKLQVVHPPGAPLFLIVGRVFAWLGDVFSSDPSTIAFAVNLMSGMFTALAATLVGHSTMLLSKYFFKNEEDENEVGDWLSAAAGIIAGLATAFSSSIWFSAVEGEVYAMSTFFTALTVWAVIKWYSLPNEGKHDKWLVFSAYSAGLSIGVHLLSLLTFPALALFVYFKKSKSVSWKGAIGSVILGAITIPIIQSLIIVGIPKLWKSMDIFVVNSMGMPFHFGLIPTLLVVGGMFFFLFRYARKKRNQWIQLAAMGALMITIGYSTIGVVVLRANADTPVNMNVPSDAARLLPYLNREQYGERALLFGPHYEANPTSYDREKRHGRQDFPPFHAETGSTQYEYVDEKITAKFNASDKMLLPRIGHAEMGRPNLYKQWYGSIMNGQPKPSMAFNIAFLLKYQINYMYFRYFMWNFVGRQNGEQGYFSWDKSKGNWESGINLIDEAKLYNMDEEPETMKNDRASNNYYFLPLIFGLIGLFYHAKKRPEEFASLFALFLITGLGIIFYTNQPPNEPRERDYVLVGSFFTFCMWIGMAVPALYQMIAQRYSFKGMPATIGLAALVATAPIIMGFQNFDDHSRKDQYGARDYAKNFLNSVDDNAIIFTYGDNDTYPLWYVQEVENVRRDVRIVNLSLIAVDWYINKLRRKVNDSEPLKLTIPASAYRGNKRNQIPFGGEDTRPLPLENVLKFVGERHPVGTGSFTFESYVPTRELFIPTNYRAVESLNMFNPADSVKIEPRIQIRFSKNKSWLTKDDLAVLDIISSNIWERPIYFATTCQNSKLLGMNDYMQYEGLALRVVPVKTKSDKSLSIYGSGRVATDKVYDNIINKFEWGNFDKKETYINTSYAAAIQAHRMIMSRTAEDFLDKGDLQKAVDMADKYFEAFPHFNFPYDAGVIPFLNVYTRTGQFDKAKEHIRILARESAEYLNFYESIDPDIVASSFSIDLPRRQNAVANIFVLARAINDAAFSEEIEQMIGKYRATSIPN